MERCPWAQGDELMETYHDNEWGRPVHDERRHFEFLLLECFQAGLSWRTILGKREGFRRAFADFDVERVARYTGEDVLRLKNDRSIIRNTGKIKAAVANAQVFIRIQKEWGSFDRYIWSFTDGRVITTGARHQEDIPVSTELSDRVSRDMKLRGFSFVGTVTIYAHLQAIGVINDHITGCFCRAPAQQKQS